MNAAHTPPRSKNFLSHDRGFTLPLFAMLIAVFLGIAALVIDHSKEEIAVQNIQRAADAAALAAARRLNGRVDGWWDSKKAAIVALRNNPIHGADPKKVSTIKLNAGGPSAFWDDSKKFELFTAAARSAYAPPTTNSGTRGSAGGVNVVVERGIYWRDSETGVYQFRSLETDDDGLKGAAPLYVLANAVKVKVSLDKLNTLFGGTFGVNVFENLQRESIAVMDNALDRPVAPIGIPLCQLLFNTNPNVVRGVHMTEKYNGNMHCERPTYVTENNAKGELATQFDGPVGAGDSAVLTRDDRIDGITRAESFERPAYFREFRYGKANLCFGEPFAGGAFNCKSLPIYATLGVPSSRPGGTADADEVVTAFTTGQSRASIGSFFKPLETLQGMTENGVRDKLARAINDSPSTFRSVFFKGGRPTNNYPFLRTDHINGPADPQQRPPIGGRKNEWYDRNISMPVEGGLLDNRNKLKFLMHDMAEAPGATGVTSTQLNYTNPMCHDDRIYHNDPDQARVLEAYAMVLAPGIEKHKGSLVQYCDFMRVFAYDESLAMFKSESQVAVAPIPESKPTVVGFVKVNVFDLNFELLNTRERGVSDPRNPSVIQTPATPVYINGNGALWDGNPKGLNLYGDKAYNDIYNNANTFEQEYKQYLACLGGLSCGMSKPKPAQSMYEIPDNLRECFDFTEYMGLLNAMGGKDKKKDPLTAVNDMVVILEKPIYSKPDKHCIPRLKNDYVDKNSSESYEPLRDLKPGVGCGGLRARLDCGTPNTVIPSGKDWDQNNPTIVSVES